MLCIKKYLCKNFIINNTHSTLLLYCTGHLLSSTHKRNIKIGTPTISDIPKYIRIIIARSLYGLVTESSASVMFVFGSTVIIE